MSTMPEIDNNAMSFADMAFIGARGSAADRVAAAVWAYEWAKINTQERWGMTVYPSADELQQALRDRTR